ncbi:HD domain-containing protein [candidate division WWE3 bacterium]|nr:HD domain-containing protein [candidate division WWE3 bacterium]
MAKQFYVSDLIKSPGLVGSTLLLLNHKEIKTTRANKPFADLTLSDRTGEMSGKIWSEGVNQTQSIANGDIVLIDFEIQTYQGRTEMVIRQIRKVTEYELDDFVSAPDHLNPEELKRELAKRIDSIRDFHVRKLIDAFFDDPEFYQHFTTIPAGEKVHHAYRHGLLQHTLEMLSILDGVLKLYPDLDHDIMTAGALLHDIGKIRECTVTSTGIVERTVIGRLMGHIYLGTQMINERMPNDFPDNFAKHLIHIILSHQGKLEQGSVTIPSTREAIAVYHADVLSMDLNIAASMMRNAKAMPALDGITPTFTEYNKYIGTSIFLGE